jgi:hypothetical protein
MNANPNHPDGYDDAWTCGFASALATMHKVTGASSSVCYVASSAGLTIARAKNARCEPYDIDELSRAGVK